MPNAVTISRSSSTSANGQPRTGNRLSRPDASRPKLIGCQTTSSKQSTRSKPGILWSGGSGRSGGSGGSERAPPSTPPDPPDLPDPPDPPDPHRFILRP